MRTAVIILIILFLLSCVKEEPIKNGPYNDWVTESLNPDYLIQFPPYFVGNGFTDSRFFKKSPSGDIRIFYECIGRWWECVGDTIRAPYPESITILPFFASSSFIWLKNRHYLYNCNHICDLGGFTGNMICKDEQFFENAIDETIIWEN